jgi:LytS/YehU family sensor histidine kinase
MGWDGNWGKAAVFEFNIKSPFWQTGWFLLLCLLILFAGIYLAVRKRVQIVRNKGALKQKIAETEMMALKAQMNPHFMFNCINSIDAFIHTNDKYNATLYLNKFAKLLRNILDSSKQNIVSFTKDIETLKLYIELEELRNENKFKTIIQIDDELLNSDYKVPPLIIQPFAENAILHGLKNKEGNDGLLEIEIKKVGEKIQYSIKDNGIGRVAARQIPQNKESSYGMQLSYDRIRLFNKEQEASVKFIDLFNDGKAGGTLIKVELKII